MEIAMSNPPQNSRTKNFFSSPALSLSLAGIFRGANAAGEAQEVEQGDEGSGGAGPSGVGRKATEDTVEISSENSLMRSRSDDDIEGGGDHEEDEDGDGTRKKKRKKYHRHTADQIREMEVMFKESPHPDDNQRQQLSKKLGLAPRQVKFWFQNRRTQIKAIQERHENSLLKTEVEKLREDNSAMREAMNRSCCHSCGAAAASTAELSFSSEEQQLRIENAKLRAEVEKLRAVIGNQAAGSSETCTEENQKVMESQSSLELQTGRFAMEKTRILEISEQATDELKRMAAANEPLWIRSVETGREILNYDEYVKEFMKEDPSSSLMGSIEASRETAVVLIDLSRLIQSFMVVNLWKEMFPFLISKAASVDIIANGDGESPNGAVQLMYAEIQMMTPMVPTREIYFIRSCKKISAEKWAIVDVSVDKIEDSIDASLAKCRKRPSECIIEDEGNGHCKVSWVEHLECQKSAVHSAFRAIVHSGIAFGARHWVSSLQLQSERLVFCMATNVPTKDSTGVATLAGRKSVLKMAQRMTCSFCRAVGGSSHNSWSKIAGKNGEDIRVSSRKNICGPGEPQGFIVCAVSSVWLPVSPNLVFHFLRDESRRNEWDIMTSGGAVERIAELSKGQDKGNAVTIQAIKAKEQSVWIIQDSSTNAYESLLVYAAVDMNGMQSVITGCDSSSVSLLPSGFSILPDGLESRPLVISSKQEGKGAEGGSLLTIAYQISTGTAPTSKITMDSVESVGTLISCTLRNIKTSLHCDDG